MHEVERWKREAAEAAVELVRPGMILGLGHGSTARYALLKIAELLRSRKTLGYPGCPLLQKSGGGGPRFRESRLPRWRIIPSSISPLTALMKLIQSST
jgi:hypothetical protein